jgi:hypothetical protein
LAVPLASLSGAKDFSWPDGFGDLAPVSELDLGGVAAPFAAHRQHVLVQAQLVAVRLDRFGHAAGVFDPRAGHFAAADVHRVLAMCRLLEVVRGIVAARGQVRRGRSQVGREHRAIDSGRAQVRVKLADFGRPDFNAAFLAVLPRRRLGLFVRGGHQSTRLDGRLDEILVPLGVEGHGAQLGFIIEIHFEPAAGVLAGAIAARVENIHAGNPHLEAWPLVFELAIAERRFAVRAQLAHECFDGRALQVGQKFPHDGGGQVFRGRIGDELR